MNFFRKLSKKKEPKLSEDTKMLRYFTDEFSSIGDTLKDGKLNYGEFIRLMELLQYKKDAKKLWKSEGKPLGSGTMTKEEYIAMMAKGKVEKESGTWRKMYNEFDADSNGYVSYQELTKGLATLGMSDSKAAKTVAAKMDTDKDGKITYVEFLKEQLNIQ